MKRGNRILIIACIVLGILLLWPYPPKVEARAFVEPTLASVAKQQEYDRVRIVLQDKSYKYWESRAIEDLDRKKETANESCH